VTITEIHTGGKQKSGEAPWPRKKVLGRRPPAKEKEKTGEGVVLFGARLGSGPARQKRKKEGQGRGTPTKKQRGAALVRLPSRHIWGGTESTAAGTRRGHHGGEVPLKPLALPSASCQKG